MSNHLIRTIDGAVVNIVDDVLAHHDATSDRALEILLQLRDRLGGITDENERLIREAGAAGACRMADYARRRGVRQAAPCKYERSRG